MGSICTGGSPADVAALALDIRPMQDFINEKTEDESGARSGPWQIRTVFLGPS